MTTRTRRRTPATASRPVRALAEPLERRLLLAAAVEPQAASLAGTPRFVENDGQWDASVVLAAHSDSGSTIRFTDAGPVFGLTDFEDAKPAAKTNAADALRPDTDRAAPVVKSTDTLAVTFPGARRVRPVGINPLETVHNYYLGNDPSQWATNVHTFGGVKYADLWEGVDLYAYAKPGGLKYEFHVAPGADPTQVRLRYAGHDAPLRLDPAGRLVVETAAGDLTDAAPLLYQADAATLQKAVAAGPAFDPAADPAVSPVPGRYTLLGDDTYALTLDAGYDRQKSGQDEANLWLCLMPAHVRNAA